MTTFVWCTLISITDNIHSRNPRPSWSIEWLTAVQDCHHHISCRGLVRSPHHCWSDEVTKVVSGRRTRSNDGTPVYIR